MPSDAACAPAVDAALLAITARAVAIENHDDMAVVATIAAGDPTIGRLAADALDHVGEQGVITIEHANAVGMTLTFSEGVELKSGCLSPHLITDPVRREIVFDDCLILAVDDRVARAADLVPLLEQVAAQTSPLLVIAHAVDGEALATLVVNSLRGTIRATAVKASGFGEHRTALLADVAALTGAMVIGGETGTALSSMTLAQLGRRPAGHRHRRCHHHRRWRCPTG